MWVYKKSLQYPVNVTKKDLEMAKLLSEQTGGQNGELGAALRYLSQSYTMPDSKGKALLIDIATEELGHIEMINAMIYQLLEGATAEEMKKAGLASHFAQHGLGIYPSDSNGVPFSVTGFVVTGDPIADLYEDMAADAAIIYGLQIHRKV